MVPIFLLGSAVYFGLQLTRSKLSHDKYMQEAKQQVLTLEAEIDVLQQNRATTVISDASSKKPSHWWW